MKLINCKYASESGFANGSPLTIQPEPMRHKDAILKALPVEVGQEDKRAMDAMLMWLESPQDQEVYAPPYRRK